MALRGLTELILAKAQRNTEDVALAVAKLAKSQKKKRKKSARSGYEHDSAEPFPVSFSERTQAEIIAKGGPLIPPDKLLAVQATAEVAYDTSSGRLVEPDEIEADVPGEADPKVKKIQGFYIERPANQRRLYMQTGDGSTIVATHRRNGVFMIERFSVEEILGFLKHARQNEMLPPGTSV